MADSGDLAFATVAVQVIPVALIVIAADAFTTRDEPHPIHRIFASSLAAWGLLYGVIGEWFGFRAILYGANGLTAPTVSGSLMAVGAVVIGPRFISLMLYERSELARRFTQIVMPSAAGVVGLNVAVWSGTNPLRLLVLAFSLVTLGLSIFTAIHFTFTGANARRDAAHGSERGRVDSRIPTADITDQPANSPETACPNDLTVARRIRGWIYCGLIAAAIAGAWRRGRELRRCWRMR